MGPPAHYLVHEGVIAGSYPGTADAVRALEHGGVTVFIDLTHPSDPLEGYDRLLEQSRRIGHPIPDMGTPTAGHMIQILDDIDAAAEDGGSVYVHCWGGVGRTGTVIGCWLVRHSYDDGDAIAQIARLRRDVPGRRSSPETAGQIALVSSWRQGR